jgi:hypothetical protein
MLCCYNFIYELMFTFTKQNQHHAKAISIQLVTGKSITQYDTKYLHENKSIHKQKKHKKCASLSQHKEQLHAMHQTHTH